MFHHRLKLADLNLILDKHIHKDQRIEKYGGNKTLSGIKIYPPNKVSDNFIIEESGFNRNFISKNDYFKKLQDKGLPYNLNDILFDKLRSLNNNDKMVNVSYSQNDESSNSKMLISSELNIAKFTSSFTPTSQIKNKRFSIDSFDSTENIDNERSRSDITLIPQITKIPIIYRSDSADSIMYCSYNNFSKSIISILKKNKKSNDAITSL